ILCWPQQSLSADVQISPKQRYVAPIGRKAQARKVPTRNSIGGLEISINEHREQILPVLRVLTRARMQMPDYFDLSIDLAGRAGISSNSLEVIGYKNGGKGGGHYWAKARADTPPPILATASKPDRENEFLRVSVHLIGPEILYATQR